MNCIIVDDEPIARRGMKRLVESREELTLLETFDNAEAARLYLTENGVDLIFLDIEMPGVNGLDFARTLPEDLFVIFTTAYSEYAPDSYEVSAIDYLLKPIDPERFNKAVDKAIERKQLLAGREEPAGSDFIIVKADRRFVRVRFDDILYVEGLKDYLVINLGERKVVTRMTVKALEELLPSSRFVRVNKSYIVNWDRIDAFTNNDIYIGDAEIAIGVSYKENILSKLLGK